MLLTLFQACGSMAVGPCGWSVYRHCIIVRPANGTFPLLSAFVKWYLYRFCFITYPGSLLTNRTNMLSMRNWLVKAALFNKLSTVPSLHCRPYHRKSHAGYSFTWFGKLEVHANLRTYAGMCWARTRWLRQKA